MNNKKIIYLLIFKVLIIAVFTNNSFVPYGYNLYLSTLLLANLIGYLYVYKNYGSISIILVENKKLLYLFIVYLSVYIINYASYFNEDISTFDFSESSISVLPHSYSVRDSFLVVVGIILTLFFLNLCCLIHKGSFSNKIPIYCINCIIIIGIVCCFFGILHKINITDYNLIFKYDGNLCAFLNLCIPLIIYKITKAQTKGLCINYTLILILFVLLIFSYDSKSGQITAGLILIYNCYLFSSKQDYSWKIILFSLIILVTLFSGHIFNKIISVSEVNFYSRNVGERILNQVTIEFYYDQNSDIGDNQVFFVTNSSKTSFRDYYLNCEINNEYIKLKLFNYKDSSYVLLRSKNFNELLSNHHNQLNFYKNDSDWNVRLNNKPLTCEKIHIGNPTIGFNTLLEFSHFYVNNRNRNQLDNRKIKVYSLGLEFQNGVKYNVFDNNKILSLFRLANFSCERSIMIQNNIEIIKNNLLYGIGPGSWSNVYLLYRKSGQIWEKWLHCDLLQMFSEYGIIGSSMILYFLLKSIMATYKVKCRTNHDFNLYSRQSLFGFIAISFVDFPFQVHGLSFIFFFILSISTKQKNE